MATIDQSQPAVRGQFYQPERRKTRGNLNTQDKAQPSSVDVNIEWKRRSNSILLYSTDATKQKILNVLNTLVGEEHFEPGWGSLLPLRLWEPSQRGLTLLLKGDIIDALRTHLRGIIYLYHGFCRVFPDPDGEGYMAIVVYDDLSTVNNPHYLLYPFNI